MARSCRNKDRLCWTKNNGCLPRDVQPFEVTVAENIAQLEMQIDAVGIVGAAEEARVNDANLALPKTCDTVIGSESVQMSDRQKQPLALACALYNDPVLLFQDEPNSALDADGPEALNETVATMKSEGKKRRHHAPSTGRHPILYTLLVLNEGQVTGFIPHGEAIKSMTANADQVQRNLRTGTGR